MSMTSIWSLAGWTMFHYVWAGTVFTLIAWSGRRVLRSAHPDVHYAYSLACLHVLAFMPIVIAGFIYVPPISEVPIAAGISRETQDFSEISSEPIVPSINVSHSHSEPFRLTTLVDGLPWLWLAGSPITFIWLAFGLAGAERLRRLSHSRSDTLLTSQLRALSQAIGVSQRVAIAICDKITGPVLVGIIRPLILLPPCALTGWTVEAMEMALLHELAHVRRQDNLVNLLQRLWESLFFFQPMIWIVSGWVRSDREQSCDHLVVTQTGRPLAYAQTLLALSDSQPVASCLGQAMAEGSLLVRIRKIMKIKEEPM